MHFSNGCIELTYGSSTQICYRTLTKFPLLSDFSSDSFYFSLYAFRNDKFRSKVNHPFVRAFVRLKSSWVKDSNRFRMHGRKKFDSFVRCESGKIALRGFVSRARGSRVWAVQARKRNGRRRRCSRLLGPVIRLGTPNTSAQPAGR